MLFTFFNCSEMTWNCQMWASCCPNGPLNSPREAFNGRTGGKWRNVSIDCQRFWRVPGKAPTTFSYLQGKNIPRFALVFEKETHKRQTWPTMWCLLNFKNIYENLTNKFPWVDVVCVNASLTFKYFPSSKRFNIIESVESVSIPAGIAKFVTHRRCGHKAVSGGQVKGIPVWGIPIRTTQKFD